MFAPDALLPGDILEVVLHRRVRQAEPVRRCLLRSGAQDRGAPPPSVNEGDGDYITVGVQRAAVAAWTVEVVLEVPPNITKWKEVRAGGSSAWTQDTRKRAAFTASARSAATSGFVLAKAKLLGIHTDVHSLAVGDVARVDGCPVTFRWLKDS